MHMWVIYGERHLSRTLKKSPYPGRGSNRGPFDLEASTLPRRCKSRLVPQAVRTHGAPYRGYGYVSLRFGGKGTSLGKWEHNNNKQYKCMINLTDAL